MDSTAKYPVLWWEEQQEGFCGGGWQPTVGTRNVESCVGVCCLAGPSVHPHTQDGWIDWLVGFVHHHIVCARSVGVVLSQLCGSLVGFRSRSISSGSILNG